MKLTSTWQEANYRPTLKTSARGDKIIQAWCEAICLLGGKP